MPMRILAVPALAVLLAGSARAEPEMFADLNTEHVSVSVLAS
jgi:hypothetical protein